MFDELVNNGAKLDIMSLMPEEIEKKLIELGEPKFRAGQIFSWLHQKNVTSFEDMSNLSIKLRQTLNERFYIRKISIKQKLESKLDSTIKYLFELYDGNTIEAVLMEYNHGNSICISTQVGCRMGCKFCASTHGGLVRNLTTTEMLSQIYMVQQDSGRKISSCVLMGIGEPLDNFDNLITFLKLISHQDGFCLSLRHVSVSTCGIVDKIEKLMEYRFGLTLSISLHAPNDEIRNKIMPVNSKWNTEKVINACNRYVSQTKRRISIEYALIDGINDSDKCAKELSTKFSGPLFHINLIPVNPVEDSGFKSSSKSQVRRFYDILEKSGVNVTIRRTLGTDINAACGQLRRQTDNAL